MKIRVDSILPNPEQPRANFDQAALRELADSIDENGLINAITVEESEDGMYILVDGERRWRAHRMLGWSEIEAMVNAGSNGADHGRELLSRALVANLHRSDLSPIEEGRAYKKLVEMGMSYTAITRKAGVSLPTVMNRLKLMELEPETQKLVEAGKLPVDVRSTEALLTLKADDQVKMAKRLARPGIRIQTIQRACAQLNQMLQKSEEKLDIPAIDLARKQRSTAAKPLPAWTALHQVGRLPKWPVVQTTANETCRNCALYDFASEATCKDCPAVELIRRMMEVADETR